MSHPLLPKKFQIFTVYEGAKSLNIPLFSSSISAGFPSPASDYIELELDFNSLLVSHPSSTFCVRVMGDSMKDANILSGDILIVDRSLHAKSDTLVVAILNGDFLVKRLLIQGSKYLLVPENSLYETIIVNQNDEFEIWGIITFIIHQAQ